MEVILARLDALRRRGPEHLPDLLTAFTAATELLKVSNSNLLWCPPAIVSTAPFPQEVFGGCQFYPHIVPLTLALILTSKKSFFLTQRCDLPSPIDTVIRMPSESAACCVSVAEQ